MDRQAPALPKPDSRHTPTEDEFAAWCEHPVTRFVAAGWERAADLQVDAWSDAFLSAPPDTDLNTKRLELVTRADAYMAFLETTLSDYVSIFES